ncbi:MAG: hypothetical protein E7662_02570 [Ruminococcaceae bacterium]|nr:hypothetical protein [Oscillospiraceae bacterium]
MFLGKNADRNTSKEVMAAVVSMNAIDLAELVPKTSGEGLFRYVNDLLQYIGPATEEYGGKLVGVSHSGITAVFEGSCEDALMSSVSVCQRIAGNTNEHFSFQNFTVGLHYGTVYTDQVGYGSWRTPLTISESTDSARKLQTAAGRYSAHILISEDAVKQIPDFFTKFNSRSLGNIMGDGTAVYDVFDGDPLEIKLSKRRSKLFFETGIALFGEKQYAAARSHFIEIIKSDRSDRAAKEYLYLCDRIMSGEATE